MARTKKPTPFAVLDSETDPFEFGVEPRPFIWGYFDGTNYKHFRDTAKMVEFIREQKITIYAHNGGKFDYMFLLDYVNNFYKPTIINGRLSKLKIGKCTLVDSYNILPIALADYQKDTVDYSLFRAEVREANMEMISDYLHHDCVYLYQIVAAYRGEYGADLTQASGAMKTYQKMRGDKVPRHTDKATFALFKNYYHGGRVQCFKRGILDVRFKVFDINSAYPFAMTHRHPYGLGYVYGDRELPFQADVRVFYRLACASRGALPFREKPNSGLTFPDDDYVREFYITDWEYWAAKNAGLISKIKIIECVKFDDTTEFSEYVSEFYNGRIKAKLEGNREQDLLCKLRLNSLYGKFGSDYRKYENFIILPDDMEAEDWERVGEFGATNALFSAPIPDDEMKFYNVATAASITGFVRAYLLAAMVNIGFENLLYCDTDSIATMRPGNLNIGKGLGLWKDEGDFVRAGIAGKKMYIFKGDKRTGIKMASKGVRLTEAELWRVCAGGEVTHRRDSPSYSVTGKVRFTERTIKMTI